MLFFAVSIPGWMNAPETGARMALSQKMSDIESAVTKYGLENGHYPRTEDEITAAIRQTPLGESRYQRDGAPVQIWLIGHLKAKGPSFLADRPGIINYAVNEDGTRYWITASMLPAATSTTAVPLQRPDDGSPFTLTAELEPPSPAVEPAKAKAQTKK